MRADDGGLWGQVREGGCGGGVEGIENAAPLSASVGL